MKKMKLSALMLALVCVFSSFAVFSIGASAADAWDGVTGNIDWYLKDPAAKEFTISTAEDLFGLSVMCFSCDASAAVNGSDKKVYYDADKNIILDKEKVTSAAGSVDFNKFLGKTVKLTADIDLNGKAFIPIGSTGSFQGFFDGQNHKVSNLYVDTPSALHKGLKTQYFYGLFAYTANGATVNNLTIENAVFDVEPASGGNHVYAGAVIGYMKGGSINGCKVNGLTVNFKPEADFAPPVNNSTKLENSLIGGAIGCTASNLSCSAVVTGFEVKSSADDAAKCHTHEMAVYGGVSDIAIVPVFTDSSVTYTDGKVVNVGEAASGGEDKPAETIVPEDDYPEFVETEKTTTQTTDKATAAATDKAEQPSDEPQNNTTTIIIIAAVAAAVVVAVIIVVVITKKKKA